MKNKISEKEIIEFLNKQYPIWNAETWDFVGYSVKTNNKDVKKVLVCLDVNKLSIDEAIKQKVDLIISFHPFCFASSWKDVYKYDSSKRIQVEQLKKNKISVFSIHTNFDKAKYGTKYWFNKKLGLEDKVIKSYTFSSIIEYNNSISSLIVSLKSKFEINNVLTNVEDIGKIVNNVYIQPGSGDIYEFLRKTRTNKIDLLITSDIKWNEQQLLNSLGIDFIIIPHKTEDVFVEVIKNALIDKFKKEIKVIDFICKDFIKGF